MKKKTLSFLIFGDVFGKLGREVIADNCERLKKEYKPDLTIANVENMTHGSGISARTITEMMDAGVEFFTGGDHSFDNRSGFEVYKMPNAPVIRPLNMGDDSPGEGYRIVQLGSHQVLFINAIGSLFMKRKSTNAFKEIDKVLKKFSKTPLSAIIVDFHTETTSEKAAMAYHLDGKASVVFGTHTHTPTADARILPNGVGFITDVGFNGPLDSVIGISPQGAIENFMKTTKQRTHVVESGRKYLNAVFVTIDTTTARCVHIEHISKMYE